MAGVTGKAGWPRESDSMGVHPEQISEAYQESVDVGVPTQFAENGCAIITSESHQRAYGKALKNAACGEFHERNCFNW